MRHKIRNLKSLNENLNKYKRKNMGFSVHSGMSSKNHNNHLDTNGVDILEEFDIISKIRNNKYWDYSEFTDDCISYKIEDSFTMTIIFDNNHFFTKIKIILQNQKLRDSNLILIDKNIKLFSKYYFDYIYLRKLFKKIRKKFLQEKKERRINSLRNNLPKSWVRESNIDNIIDN